MHLKRFLEHHRPVQGVGNITTFCHAKRFVAAPDLLVYGAKWKALIVRDTNLVIDLAQLQVKASRVLRAHQIPSFSRLLFWSQTVLSSSSLRTPRFFANSISSLLTIYGSPRSVKIIMGPSEVLLHVSSKTAFIIAV